MASQESLRICILFRRWCSPYENPIPNQDFEPLVEHILPLPSDILASFLISSVTPVGRKAQNWYKNHLMEDLPYVRSLHRQYYALVTPTAQLGLRSPPPPPNRFSQVKVFFPKRCVEFLIAHSWLNPFFQIFNRFSIYLFYLKQHEKPKYFVFIICCRLL